MLAVPLFQGTTETARDEAFVAWLGGPDGRAWLSTNLKTGWECSGKLLAVHVEELKWEDERQAKNPAEVK